MHDKEQPSLPFFQSRHAQSGGRQGCVLTIAVALGAAGFNIIAVRWLPVFDGLSLISIILGLFAVRIPLSVQAPKVPSSAVWTEFANGGHWSSLGGSPSSASSPLPRHSSALTPPYVWPSRHALLVAVNSV